MVIAETARSIYYHDASCLFLAGRVEHRRTRFLTSRDGYCHSSTFGESPEPLSSARFRDEGNGADGRPLGGVRQVLQLINRPAANKPVKEEKDGEPGQYRLASGLIERGRWD